MMHKTPKGFSLVELIVVVAIMAVLAAVIVPSVSGTKEAAEEQAAKAAAGTLNLAQSQWRLANDVSSWPGAGDQAGCYDAVKQYMEYADDWAAFQKRYNEDGGGYTFAFKDLVNSKMQKVALTDKSGKDVPY